MITSRQDDLNKTADLTEHTRVSLGSSTPSQIDYSLNSVRHSMHKLRAIGSMPTVKDLSARSIIGIANVILLTQFSLTIT